MKLKKKIMLVVSMAIMTLSIFLTDMQVLAATDNMSDLITFGNKYYESAWFYGPEIIIIEGGQAVNVGGEVYNYKDAYNGEIEFKISGKYQFANLTSTGSNSIAFSDSTNGLIWDYNGTLKHSFTTTSTSDSPNMIIKMSLMDINMIVYNQSYDYPINSGTTATQSGTDATTTMNCYLNIPYVSERKILSDYDVEVEATFLLTYSIADYDTSATYTIKPRCYVTLDYLKFYEVYSADITNLSAILSALNEIKLLVGQNQTLMQTYYPKLNELLLKLTHVDLDMDSLIDLTEDVVTELGNIKSELVDANTTLDSVDEGVGQLNVKIVRLHNEVVSLHNDLIKSSDADKSTTDGFKQDSDSQSSELNELNQQTQVDKIDVDNASGTVDDNLNVEVDANYGVLLSTFTNNNKILTMLLAVSSMGLISYVLFGKR